MKREVRFFCLLLLSSLNCVVNHERKLWSYHHTIRLCTILWKSFHSAQRKFKIENFCFFFIRLHFTIGEWKNAITFRAIRSRNSYQFYANFDILKCVSLHLTTTKNLCASTWKLSFFTFLLFFLYAPHIT